MKLISLKPSGAKLLASVFNSFDRRRFGRIQRVIDTELLPFVTAHLMKGQYIYSLDVAQPGSEFRNLCDIFGVIGQSRH